MDIYKDQEEEFNHVMPLTENAQNHSIQVYLHWSVTSWQVGRPPHLKVAHAVEQLCIIDLTLSKRRLNKSHYKTLHKSGICRLP